MVALPGFAAILSSLASLAGWLAFPVVLSSENYIRQTVAHEPQVNFKLLLTNRQPINLAYLSNEPFKLLAAGAAGVRVIPVVSFEPGDDQHILRLVKHYLQRTREVSEFRTEAEDEFSFLQRLA